MATSAGDLPQPDYSEAGVNRDDVVGSRIDTALSTLTGGIVASYALEGRSASAGQTSVSLAFGGGTALAAGDVGQPVTSNCYLDSVSVSWLSGTDPGADWVLTFWRRTDSGTMSAAATFPVSTS